MDKKSIVVIIIFTFAFSIFVALKLFNNSEPVSLGKEFSMEAEQFVTMDNDEKTTIKLVSIKNSKCEEDDVCDMPQGLEYKLLINGEENIVNEIPSSINLYGNYQLQIVDGDEDRLILKMVKHS